MMSSKYSRVCAEIDMDAIAENFRIMHEAIHPETKMVAVIKTDGYGHGAVPIAQMIQPEDYIWGFAVATMTEAMILRKNQITKPVLILGYTFEEDYEDLIRYEIRPIVFKLDMAKELSEAAVHLKKTLSIHIGLDTGMSRIGYQVSEASADEIAKTAELKNLKIEGVFTHFAKADEADKTHVHGQIAAYQKMLTMLEERGVEIPLKHCSNSAGIIDLPEVNMDAVRAGIILYGLLPSDEVQKERIDLEPVMTLKSKVIHIKTLEKGRTISYGGTYEVTHTERIATIPVGYGDGYPRSLSNKGWVLIHGQKAPICGRICMDQFMVDVTDIPKVRVGDEVTLIGTDGSETLSMNELGELSERFNYEFACDLGKRIPRVFYADGKIVDTKDYFDE